MIAAFVTFGLFWGSWAVMVFNIQRTFALSDAGLGVLLALAIALAGASSAVMAHLANRVGARRMLWIALLAWSGLLVVMSAAQQKWAFVALAGAGRDRRGQHRHRHERRGDPPPARQTVVAPPFPRSVQLRGDRRRGRGRDRHPCRYLMALGLARGGGDRAGRRPVDALPRYPSLRRMPRRQPPAWRHRGTPSRRIRRDGLLLLLAIFALAEVTEGGVDTWGVLYLRNHLATGVLLGAGAYIVGQVVAATTRSAGSTVVGRLSARHALVVGGCIAGGGILLESLTPLSGLAALGLALGAGGASLFWPLVMSNVSRLASQVVSAVGTFTAAGYIGWVAGAPIVGWVSQTFGPQHGLQVLAVAALAVAAVSLLGTQRRPRTGPTG